MEPAAGAKQEGQDATLDLGIEIPLRHLNTLLRMALSIIENRR